MVIHAERGAEDDVGDALEAADPLFVLRMLPTGIEYVYPALGNKQGVSIVISQQDRRPNARTAYLNGESLPKLNGVSVIPMLFCPARKTSVSVGT